MFCIKPLHNYKIIHVKIDNYSFLDKEILTVYLKCYFSGVTRPDRGTGECVRDI